MPSPFSTELKQRIITFFKEDYGLDISESEAEMFLTALANLYCSYKNMLAEYFALAGEENLDTMNV
jgi:hypothetical protein